jgi:hypothetical protein
MMLSDYFSAEGENAFPSQETLAARLGLSVRSVGRHLSTAEAEGWIYRFERPGRKARAHIQHQYVATIPEQLIPLCKAGPWEIDPAWRSEKIRSPKAPLRHGDNLAKLGQGEVPAKAPQGDNLTRQGANLSAQPDNLAGTGRQFGNDRVSNCPTIFPSELSSEDTQGEIPSELCRSKAAAPPGLGILDEKSLKAEEPAAAAKPTLRQVRNGKAEFSDLPKDERWRLATELMAKVPSQPLVWVAREFDLPMDELLAHAKAH